MAPGDGADGPEAFLYGESGTRKATATTAACSRDREELLGQHSDFSRLCEGAAEKSANATRKAAPVRCFRGSQPIGMSTGDAVDF